MPAALLSARLARRRGARLGWRALAALVLLALVGSGIELVVTKQEADRLEDAVAADFRAGSHELQLGRDLVAQANRQRDVSPLAQAEVAFGAARRHFTRAAASLNASRRLATLAGLPVAGTVVRSRLGTATQLVAMGNSLADAGDSVIVLDRLLLHPQGATSVGATMLDVLRQATPAIQDVHSHLDRARAASALVDLSAVPASQRAQVAAGIGLVREASASIDELDRLVPVLISFLGGSGGRQYLIEQVNPAELRAGGGFVGSYSLVKIDQGSISLPQTGNTWLLPRPQEGQPGYVAPPATMREFIGTGSWTLEDSNFFPDFPSNARAAEDLAAHELGIKPDGVISIDPDLVGSLLALTGPITVPGYGITVRSEGFADQLYELQNGPHRLPAHKEFLAALAAPLLQKVLTLSPDVWSELADRLAGAATARHLQAFFNDPAAEEEMVRVGWAGTLNPRGQQIFMAEIESNFGATKANHFLQRSYSLVLRRTATSLHQRLTVEYINSTPPGGPDPQFYRCYARLYTSKLLTPPILLGGKPDAYPNTDVPSNLSLMDMWFQVDVTPSAPGRASISFDYVTRWPAAGEESSIYWQKQPGTGPDPIHISWTSDGQTHEAEGRLSQDMVIYLSPDGVKVGPAAAATARLPSLGL